MTEWLYDAKKDDPLTAYRIAAIPGSVGEYPYIVAFDTTSPERPTEREARLLQSFLQEYVSYWYSDSWKARMAQEPFDIDGTANGIVFYKRGENDWAYRRNFWTSGPLYWPSVTDSVGPLLLSSLLDHIHRHGDSTLSPRWLKWKAEHPDLFS